MRSILLSAVVHIVIAGLGAFDSARAAALAFDSAADPAYAPYLATGAPVTGVNAGYGWGPWEEWYSSGVSSTSRYIHLYDYSTNGANWSQSPLTSPGAVWEIPGLPDGFDPPAYAVRYFDGSLAVGQTLSFDYESVGTIGILSSDGTDATYMITSGNPAFVYFEHTLPFVQFQTNLALNAGAAHISITPIDSDHAIMSITSYGPLGGTASIEMPYADVDGVAFETNPRDSAGYVNNLSITPEPGTAALFAAVGCALLLKRKAARKK